MHMHLLWFFVVVSFSSHWFMWMICLYSPDLLQWHWGNHCPSASEVTLNDMGKMSSTKPPTQPSGNYMHISWDVLYVWYQLVVWIWKCHLTSIGNPIMEIRWSQDRLISTMGFRKMASIHWINSLSAFEETNSNAFLRQLPLYCFHIICS